MTQLCTLLRLASQMSTLLGKLLDHENDRHGGELILLGR